MINKAVYNLFKRVLSEGNSTEVCLEKGIVFLNGSKYCYEEIKELLLNQSQLDKSFHKKWKVIRDSDKEVLILEQMRHYLSTYGTNFEGEVYEPDEEVSGVRNLKFNVIKGVSKETIIDKVKNILSSGVALSQQSLNDILLILDYFEQDYKKYYVISKNKEFNSRLILKGDVVSENPEEVLRACVLASTGESLLIKNKEVISKIKESDYNPEDLFKSTGLPKLSQIFNRFKPLFLAYKDKCPSAINKISKLSKKHHKPLPNNPLNSVTRLKLTTELHESNTLTLLRAYNSLHTYAGGKEAVVYKIRNGRAWCEEKNISVNDEIIQHNKLKIKDELLRRLDLKGKMLYIPSGITYSLPTSEKLMFGGIPYGSSVEGKNLAVGIYWENSWGARDLDLSGVSLSSKVGWNSSYNKNGLLYSGDKTDAKDGAVEYLHCKEGVHEPCLIQNNVYNGDDNTRYRIVVGSGVDIDYDFMMSLDNLLFYCDTESQSKNTYLGLLSNTNGVGKFTLTNVVVGNARVSSDNPVSIAARKAMLEDLEKQATLNELFRDFVTDKFSEDCLDLSPSNLGKDTLLSLFK